MHVQQLKCDVMIANRHFVALVFAYFTPKAKSANTSQNLSGNLSILGKHIAHFANDALAPIVAFDAMANFAIPVMHVCMNLSVSSQYDRFKQFQRYHARKLVQTVERPLRRSA